MHGAGGAHHENHFGGDVPAYEVPIPLEALKTKSDGAREELVGVLADKNGVELRRANLEKKDGNFAKVAYFKGSRLFNSFKTKDGNTPNAKNTPQVLEYGQWLLDQRYIILCKISDKQKKILKQVTFAPAFAPTFEPSGFYVWTKHIKKLTSPSPKRPVSMKKGTGGEGLGEDLGEKKKGGISWLHVGLLLLIIGPSLFAVGGYLIDLISTTSFGLAVGLSQTPRARLTEFYTKHDASKLANIDKLLKKYSGREEVLFKKLERKYEKKAENSRKREEAKKQDAREGYTEGGL
eukprot:g5689.t1